ncbi:hypothetical protein [Methylocystis rosea]|nr:hypothetical protein [Methylocystis rosea]
MTAIASTPRERGRWRIDRWDCALFIANLICISPARAPETKKAAA